MFGVAPAEAMISLSPFRVYNDEITVTGSMAILRSFAPAVELIGSGAVDPRPLLSAPLPLDEFGEALHRVRAGRGNQVAHQALLDPKTAPSSPRCAPRP